MDPAKGYLRMHNPPILWDRVLGHALELPISVLAFLLSLLLVCNEWGGASMSPLFADLGTWHVVLMAALLGNGGALSMLGILLPFRHARDRAWLLEQAGWVVQCSGWALSGVLVGASANHVVVSVLTASFIALGGLLRVLALKRTDRGTRASLRRQEAMVEQYKAQGEA